jgi:hypothetical protein
VHIARGQRVPDREAGVEGRLLGRRQRQRLARKAADVFFLRRVHRLAQQLHDGEALGGGQRVAVEQVEALQQQRLHLHMIV